MAPRKEKESYMGAVPSIRYEPLVSQPTPLTIIRQALACHTQTETMSDLQRQQLATHLNDMNRRLDKLKRRGRLFAGIGLSDDMGGLRARLAAQGCACAPNQQTPCVCDDAPLLPDVSTMTCDYSPQ
jgi:hypothetical protein